MKEVLTRLGLSTQGVKKDLVARILEAVAARAAEEAAEVGAPAEEQPGDDDDSGEDDSGNDGDDDSAEDEDDAERTFERIFCGGELKLNRLTPHLDASDVLPLLRVSKHLLGELTGLSALEVDGAAEYPRALWRRLCAEKAKRLGLTHQLDAWRTLVDECEEWNAEDDTRPPHLKTSLADDPWTYYMVLDAGKVTEGVAFGQRGEDQTPVKFPPGLWGHLVLMQGMRDMAEAALLQNESYVLQRLFALEHKGEARELRLSMLSICAADARDLVLPR